VKSTVTLKPRLGSLKVVGNNTIQLTAYDITFTSLACTVSDIIAANWP